MRITKIVITGGPCGGKTTAMSWIQNAFTQLGYKVLFVPETATELLGGGVTPWTCGTNVDYQKCQMRLQLTKDQLFDYAARTMKEDRILIVNDRGALDNRAYMNDEEFTEVLRSLGTSEVELMGGYDAVFHLVTAAKGAAEFYTTANNTVRYESVESACAVDDRLIAAWTGHPHFRVIDNSTDFSLKMKNLIDEISSFLGEQERSSSMHRYSIVRPDAQVLQQIPACRRIDIVQHYLKTADGEEIRIRRRGIDGHFIYFQTRIRKTDQPQYIEIERRLSEEEYLELSEQADPERAAVVKTRYCFTHGNQVIEIDLSVDEKEQTVMEVFTGAAEVQLPDFVTVLSELTA